MDFDREALNDMLDQKLERAERAIIRNYLKDCGVEGDDLTDNVNAIIEERAKANSGIAEELNCAKEKISNLEGEIRQQSISFAVAQCMAQLGVKRELYNDVKLLAADGINSAVDSDGTVDTSAVQSAISAVIDRIPSVTANSAVSDSSDTSHSEGIHIGSMGNFARNNDSTALMKNRLNSARAAGDNALSVSIISEAASMGITLR